MKQSLFNDLSWGKATFLFITILLLVVLPAYVFLFVGAYILANSVHQWTAGKTLYKALFWIALVIISGAGMLLFGSQLNIDFSAFLEQIQSGVSVLQEELAEYDLFSGANLKSIVDSGVGQQLLQPLGNAFRIMGLMLFLVLMSLFMSFELERLNELLIGTIKHVSYQPKKLQKKLEAVPSTLHAWIQNRLLSMLIVGVMTYIGLLFVDIEYRFWLGLLAAVLSFIPNLGPLLSFIPAALLGISSGPITLLMLAGIYTIVQILESNIITPLILKKTMSVPISLTFAFQIVFSSLFGFLGLIFAVPIGIVLMQVTGVSPQEK